MNVPIETDDKVMTSSSKVEYIMAEHDDCIKEDTFESDLHEDKFIQQIKVKIELIDVNSSLTKNQGISDGNIEIKEEILELNSLEENGEQLDSESQQKRENFESDLSEDNFVGLYESSQTNDEFIENQAISDIDPLEVKTETNSTVDSGNKSFSNCSLFEVKTEDNLTVVHENGTIISYDSHKKSFLNCPKLSCNYKSADNDELANHIASIHQGNIILDESKNIPDVYQKIRKVEEKALPSTRQLAKSQKEILESKSFQDYVARLSCVKVRKRSK